MRHLIEPTDLSVDETERIIDLALDIIAHREKYSEACKGQRTRPAALVLALTEIFPFHPQTIKLRLRLLQRRREYEALDAAYTAQRKQFLDFVGVSWSCDG